MFSIVLFIHVQAKFLVQHTHIVYMMDNRLMVNEGKFDKYAGYIIVVKMWTVWINSVCVI